MSTSKAKKKIDKILEHVQERVGDEVGGLMGATLVMSDLSTRLISKEDFFDEPSGKLVFSEMELSGEVEGQGCILVSIKDAVRLGGTLIMLPENELEEAALSEDYSEEIDDSYGEIANIIAGAYTKTFEEMYPKNFRFIRKKQEIITPVKVDVESDHPIPNQNYYQVSASMTLNDVKMGKLVLLIPAKALGLDEDISVAEETGSHDVASDKATPEEAVGTEGTAAAASSGNQQDAPQLADSSSSDRGESGLDADSKEKTTVAKPFDVEKQKKRVDSCLKECAERMGDEVGALLGAEVKLTEHATKIVNKEDFFFDEASGKQILAHMDVVGDIEGKSYLYTGLKDAIYIGGTLIMLPPSELDIIVAEEDFNEDAEDAYGEITNIISGVYTKVFEEQYPRKIRFIKTSLEQVVPMKVDSESDEPMPDVLYYMATSKIAIGDKSLGNLHFLVPTPLFQLEQLGVEGVADDASADTFNDASDDTTIGSVSGKGGGQAGSATVGARAASEGEKNPEFLLVSNDEGKCQRICSVLDSRGNAYRVLDYKESITDFLPGEVKAVILVMADVDEKALGVAIKVSAACQLPLIAVGSDWTRTKVIKAVKYGVDDILLTPASDGDINAKLDNISAKIAA